MKSTDANIPNYLKLLPFGGNLIHRSSETTDLTPSLIISPDNETEIETKALGMMGVMGKSPGFLANKRGVNTVNNEYGTEVRKIFKRGRRKSSRSLEVPQFSETDQIEEDSSYHGDGQDEDQDEDQALDQDDEDEDQEQDHREPNDFNEEVIGTENLMEGVSDDNDIAGSMRDSLIDSDLSSSLPLRSNHYGELQGLINQSFQPRNTHSIEIDYPLPTKLIPSGIDRSDHAPPIVTNDGLTVKHVEASSLLSHNSDYYIFKSNNQVQPSTGIFYYEVTIHGSSLSKDDTNNSKSYGNTNPKERSCGVSFGFTSSDSLGKLTSSRSEIRSPFFDLGSYVIDGTNGTITANRSVAKKFTGPFEKGDIVGCGINYCKEEIFYVRNGVYLGVAFTEFKQVLVPVIGVRYGVDITVNFGIRKYSHDIFIFDIDGYVNDQKKDVLSKILKTTDIVNNSEDSNKTVIGSFHVHQNALQITGEILNDYFEHLGFVDAAREFKNEQRGELDFERLDDLLFQEDNSHLSGDATESSDSIDGLLIIRASIREKIVVKQDISTAISLIEDNFPNIFHDNPGLLFKMKCQILLMHIMNRENEKSLEYGQQLKSEYLEFPKFQNELENIFSLLAFSNPEESDEHRGLLDPQTFSDLNDFANQAILKSIGRGFKPILQRMMDHTRELADKASDRGDDFSNSTYLVKLSDFGL